MNRLAIRIGAFFFRYRNIAFPVFVAALFLLVPPPGKLFGSKSLELAVDAGALAISVLGLAMRAVVIGYAYIKRGGKDKRVYAADLVTEGVFGISRNPLYLGNLLICVGMFLMHGDPYVLLIGVTVYAFVYVCIVQTEEAYLGKKFGAAYRAYAANVPRWWPKFSRFRDATDGMAFNFRRVLQKDYTTIASTLSVLALIELYEEVMDAGGAGQWPAIFFLATCVLLCGLFVLAVKVANKRRRARVPAPIPGEGKRSDRPVRA
jgi:protein-S-isoprenylcysteine O-methyltransferase Ste14